MKISKLISKLLLALCLIFLSSCESGGRKFFKLHVLDPIPDDVKEIVMYKDKSTINGPMVFKFKAGSETFKKIIEKQKLKAVDKPTESVAMLNPLVLKKVDWWKVESDMKLYVVEYQPKAAYDGWHTRYLYVGRGTGLFLTTGSFDPDKYIVKVERKLPILE